LNLKGQLYCKYKRIADLFTNLSVINIVQNIFHPGKEMNDQGSSATFFTIAEESDLYDETKEKRAV
jgi:hypothetical protein